MTIIQARKFSYAKMCREWRTVTKIGEKEHISYVTAFFLPSRQRITVHRKRYEHVYIVRM